MSGHFVVQAILLMYLCVGEYFSQNKFTLNLKKASAYKYIVFQLYPFMTRSSSCLTYIVMQQLNALILQKKTEKKHTSASEWFTNVPFNKHLTLSSVMIGLNLCMHMEF